jgi:hypothetical protein
MHHPTPSFAEATAAKEGICALASEHQAKLERHSTLNKKLLYLGVRRHSACYLEQNGWRVDTRRVTSFYAGIEAHIKQIKSSRWITMQAARYISLRVQPRFAAAATREVEPLLKAEAYRSPR